MKTTLRRHGAIAAVAMFGLLTACSDSTGPDDLNGPDEFNGQSAEEIAASVESMVSTMDMSDDAFQSLFLARSYLRTGAPFVAGVPGQLLTLPSPAAIREMVGTGPAASFPSNQRGVTFVYDMQEGHYLPSERMGAPKNGIRAVYYTVDPITAAPAEPLNELGYIDLTDEISSSSEREGFRIASTAGDTETTLADYYRDASRVQTQTSLSLTAAAVGFFSDGTNQLDFDLNQTISGSPDSGMFLAHDYTLSAGDVNLSLTLSADLSPTDIEDLQAEVNFTVNDGSNTAVMDFIMSGIMTPMLIEGTVTFNGGVVANISGSTEHPIFTRPDGPELNAQEVQGLMRLYDAEDKTFGLSSGVVQAP